MQICLGDSDQLNWSGTYEQFTQIHNKQIPVNNSFVADTWLAGYKVINDVNNVLAHLDIVVDAEKDRVEGEAKFIRGSVYFDLVRMYAKAWNDGDPNNNDGVPLVLTPTTLISDASKVKRNTVAEVYAQVISDLTDATQKCIEATMNIIFLQQILQLMQCLQGFICSNRIMQMHCRQKTMQLMLAEDNGYI